MPKIAALGGMSSRGFGEFAQQTSANYIEDVFSTYLYSGSSADVTINNGIDVLTNGGMVWIKNRTNASGSSAYGGGLGVNALFDTARGMNLSSFSRLLRSDGTNAESNFGTGGVGANINGFTVGYNGFMDLNLTGNIYASWTFRKQPKFFDIVTYTGNATAGRTISHNLGSVPGMMIIKRTDGATNWPVYHRSMANNEYMFLNATNAKASVQNYWNSTTPTSTVFTLGSDANVNASGGTYVAYLFAHDAGGFGADGSQNVISCGSFTKDGSGNATVTLGWEPQYVLVKSTNGSSAVGDNWLIADIMRGAAESGNTEYLYANSSAAANAGGGGGPWFVPTATGFKIQGLSGGSNHIYLAIRRGPMKTPTSGTSVFSPVVYSGNNTTRTISCGFVPDSVWFADRSATYWGQNTTIFDRLRGLVYSVSSAATSETDLSPFVTAFGQSGINITNSGMNNAANIANGYLDYFFGRAPGFFDEICYTGTGVVRTLNHNLGVVPELMIVKNRNIASSRGWAIYSSALGPTKVLLLNQTNGETVSSLPWNDTAPTASVFTVGNYANANTNGDTYFAYLFATCPGVSKVGSYTGTGATQTISCGFTGGARFVLIKRTDTTGSWYVWDTARGMVSGTDPSLLLNTTAAEVNANSVYTTTGGFQIVSTAADINASGGAYIYLAIA